MIRILDYILAFLLGCIFCIFIEFFIRPQYDTDYEHKLLSHNGYNYCPYCGENLYDSENVVIVEIGEVEK